MGFSRIRVRAATLKKTLTRPRWNLAEVTDYAVTRLSTFTVKISAYFPPCFRGKMSLRHSFTIALLFFLAGCTNFAGVSDTPRVSSAIDCPSDAGGSKCGQTAEAVETDEFPVAAAPKAEVDEMQCKAFGAKGSAEYLKCIRRRATLGVNN